jgi:sugar phosphate isomerase/epimerase
MDQGNSRRKFIYQMGAASAIALLPGGLLHAKKVKQVGLQLYTLRDVIKTDLIGTLKKVSKLGYTELEGYSNAENTFWGKDPKEFHKICKGEGLQLVSHHVGGGWDELRNGNNKTKTMLNQWEGLCEEVKAAGATFIVVPWISEQERKTLEGYRNIAEQLNKAGEVARKYDLQFCYHNHSFEFDTIEDQVPYDLLLSQTEPKFVNFEMDLFWVTKAGKDIPAYFDKYPGRFPLWHVKDMNKDTKDFAEVGSGLIEFKQIFSMAEQAGMKHFFVEQDKCPGDPLVSVGKRITYLREKFNY